jgi:hypothetical protein
MIALCGSLGFEAIVQGRSSRVCGMTTSKIAASLLPRIAACGHPNELCAVRRGAVEPHVPPLQLKQPVGMKGSE